MKYLIIFYLLQYKEHAAEHYQSAHIYVHKDIVSNK